MRQSTLAIRSLEESKQTLSVDLAMKQADIKRLSQQLVDVNKDCEVRLGSTMFEFKKLETRFSSNSEDAVQRWRIRAEELQIVVDNLRSENESLKNSSSTANGRVDRLQQQLQELRKSNGELMDRLRTQ